VVTPSRGRRQCARTIKQIGAQSGQGELLGFAVADGAGKGIPKEFRQAVAAGCQAATG
jgi:tRNA threonylcarbamoyladenosine modification (KEOPS) complex Cgi121 subunit